MGGPSPTAGRLSYRGSDRTLDFPFQPTLGHTPGVSIETGHQPAEDTKDPSRPAFEGARQGCHRRGRCQEPLKSRGQDPIEMSPWAPGSRADLPRVHPRQPRFAVMMSTRSAGGARNRAGRSSGQRSGRRTDGLGAVGQLGRMNDGRDVAREDAT